jgi:hypothetical protein
METYLGSDPRLQCLQCAGLLFCSAPGTQIIFLNFFNFSHFFFFFCSTGIRHYHSSHAPSPFCCSYFSDRVSGFHSQPALNHDPTYASHIARITEVQCHVQLICWEGTGILINFLSGLA